jgi:toxin ParE1/3/4
MQRLRVEYQHDAIADLREIYRFVIGRSQNATVAKKFVRRIEARCRRIGNVPHGGRPRDDLEPGLRTVPFERSAVIAYKVEGDLVRIVNIFYGRRDFESFYLGTADEDDGVE